MILKTTLKKSLLLNLSGMFFIFCFCADSENKLSNKQIQDFARAYSTFLLAISSDTIDASKSATIFQQTLKQYNMRLEVFTAYRDKLQQDPMAFKKMLEIVERNLQNTKDKSKTTL